MSITKRMLDLGLILLVTPLLLPLIAAVAIAVRSQLGTPTLFRQQRPGLHGAPFEMLKFRTMSNDLDEAGRPLPDHQRLSVFGRWLRSTSLDELPSLLSVLRGQMSLVGPRPLLMHYLACYSPEQARRHEVKPGLTGLAQVRGRNALSWEEKFKLDVWYVDHQSVWLDVRILVETLLKVFRREGINAAGSDTMPEFLGTRASSSDEVG